MTPSCHNLKNTILFVPFFLLLLPISGWTGEREKRVIAHYMTDMIPRTDRALSRWIDPELADPEGSTSAIGGLQIPVPMAVTQLGKADLETAADFEIRAALQMGIDGFQFYYPLGDDIGLLRGPYNRIIGEFFRLSEERYPGFRVSICLSHPSSDKWKQPEERIARWAVPVAELLEKTGQSPAWLKGENGALLMFLWVGDNLAGDNHGLAVTPYQIRKVGAAYEQLAAAVGRKIDFVYQVRRKEIDPPYVEAIVETFPAVWGWTQSEEDLEFWDYLAERCGVAGCRFTQSVYPDYFTSKVYRKGSEYEILSVEDSLKLPREEMERHYRVTSLAQTQIQLLQRAIEKEVDMINYVTWNDYPEGHHLAPERSRNFGPSLLLRHFKKIWQTGEEVIDRDEAIVFYKKYRSDVTPKYPITLEVDSVNRDLASEDRIELVTLLTEPADCFINGKPLGRVAAGLQIGSIPSEPGEVTVRVERNGDTLIEFTAPEEITDQPLRTDRLTYSYSSAFRREFDALFGGAEIE